MNLTQEQIKFYLPKIDWILKQAYREKYLGIDWIKNKATNFYLLKIETVIVGCAVTKNNKIIAVGVNSEGKGLGTKLLSKIKNILPNAWVTVDISAIGMIKVLLKSGFKIVNNQDDILQILAEEKIAITQTIQTPIVNTHDLAFVKLENGSHSNTYAQLIFN